MTARQKRIWDLLVERGCLTSQQIAGLLHISDRTVRNDIKEINKERGAEVVGSKKGQGFFIEAGQYAGPVQNGGEDWSGEDTEWEIVRRVLFEEETPYLELADELFISDTLLTRLVAKLNRKMARRHGRNAAIRKQNGRLRLELPEEELRSYYTLYIMDRNVEHYFELEYFQPFFLTVDLERLKEVMMKGLLVRRRPLYDTTIVRLLIGAAVMAERIACGHGIVGRGTAEHESVRHGSAEHGSARRGCGGDKIGGQRAAGGSPDRDAETEGESRLLFDQLCQTFSLMESEEEYQYFSWLCRDDFYYIRKEPDGRAKSILDKILIEISVEYGFDFREDSEFCQEMAAQLNGALKRSSYNQHVINPVLSPIKAKYPLEYDIAIFFADRFGQMTGESLSEDEISLFAIHFIRAMETSLGRVEQRVALINPYGKQVKDLIAKRLEEMGECRVSISHTYSIFDYPREMPRDVLAVLSTAPLLKPPLEVPVILIRNFLDYHEKEKLLTVVRDSEVNSVRTYFKTLFKPSLFYTEREFDTRQEALSFLCGKLCEQGYVDNGFLKSVMKREAIASTAFEPGFAFAHAMENNAKRTAVGVCVLKNGIPWGEYRVRIVFVFALASTWNHTMIPVYNCMIDHLFKTNTVHKLAKIKDCRQFVELLI